MCNGVLKKNEGIKCPKYNNDAFISLLYMVLNNGKYLILSVH